MQTDLEGCDQGCGGVVFGCIPVATLRSRQEACFFEGGEPVLVEAFIAELAAEAFDESVLGGFARGMKFNFTLFFCAQLWRACP